MHNEIHKESSSETSVQEFLKDSSLSVTSGLFYRCHQKFALKQEYPSKNTRHFMPLMSSAILLLWENRYKPKTPPFTIRVQSQPCAKKSTTDRHRPVEYARILRGKVELGALLNLEWMTMTKKC